ncbi:MAG: DUF3737 family protein [Clostridiales bacterium]|nr:DUF3737 family protein [Clostridiales bacterium]
MKIENKTVNEENALNECGDVQAKDCVFDSVSPLWYGRSAELENCEITDNCKAPFWYAENITVSKTKIHGTKAMRECKYAVVKDCDIVSSEFGWFMDGVRMTDCQIKGDYFMLQAKNIAARRLDYKGKYFFQYANEAIVMDSKIDSVDAFWHCKNVTVENCVIIGERLGWFSKNLTFKNCTIIGTKPLCRCKNLHLEDCVMQNTDSAFYKSEVYAILREPIDSIKNPYKGIIRAPSVGEIVRDDKNAKAKVIIDPVLKRGANRD